MKHPEYFIATTVDLERGLVLFDGDEHIHLTRVLRKKPGDTALAIDGRGGVYEFIIKEMGKTQLTGKIIHTQNGLNEPRFKLTLGQAMLKGGHTEIVLEKCTEIGVAEFWIMNTAYTVVKPADKKIHRWQRITGEAMKQCLRSVWPNVSMPMNFIEVMKKTADFDLRLIAHNSSKAQSLTTLLVPQTEPSTQLENGIVLIGPEGGFSDDEIELALSHGFELLSLGPRRLRAETSGIVAASIILNHMNEI
ncbi:16S rRNA (uracil(1498)-N(3))-methyltransferase [bacterium]|nr:16S rRNA (uracil(1498)-N(3))-methyltransferase [bacterium]